MTWAATPPLGVQPTQTSPPRVCDMHAMSSLWYSVSAVQIGRWLCNAAELLFVAACKPLWIDRRLLHILMTRTCHLDPLAVPGSRAPCRAVPEILGAAVRDALSRPVRAVARPRPDSFRPQRGRRVPPRIVAGYRQNGVRLFENHCKPHIVPAARQRTEVVHRDRSTINLTQRRIAMLRASHTTPRGPQQQVSQ